MKKIALLLIPILFLTNCTSDDTVKANEKWHLKNLSGGFAGVNNNFSSEEVVWTFNKQNLTLTIEKNTHQAISGLSEGSYPYEIREVDNHSYISIDNGDFVSITILNTEIIIDENTLINGGVSADGFTIKLEK